MKRQLTEWKKILINHIFTISMKNSYNSITPLQTIWLKMVKGGNKRGQLYGNNKKLLWVASTQCNII